MKTRIVDCYNDYYIIVRYSYLRNTPIFAKTPSLFSLGLVFSEAEYKLYILWHKCDSLAMDST